jgi:hypothetical protein
MFMLPILGVLVDFENRSNFQMGISTLVKHRTSNTMKLGKAAWIITCSITGFGNLAIASPETP